MVHLSQLYELSDKFQTRFFRQKVTNKFTNTNYRIRVICDSTFYYFFTVFNFTQAFVKETTTTQHHPCFEREHARYIPKVRAQPEIIKAIISSEELVDRAFKSKGYSVSILFIFHIFSKLSKGKLPIGFII